MSSTEQNIKIYKRLVPTQIRQRCGELRITKKSAAPRALPRQATSIVLANPGPIRLPPKPNPNISEINGITLVTLSGTTFCRMSSHPEDRLRRSDQSECSGMLLLGVGTSSGTETSKISFSATRFGRGCITLESSVDQVCQPPTSRQIGRGRRTTFSGSVATLTHMT